MKDQASMDDVFLSKVYQLIEENLDNEGYLVADLAKDIGLSRSMLHRKLIKLTGKCASEHITLIRLANAKELLERNTITVSETAYKVGYKSPSYFNKVFKKHYNISPGGLKKEAIAHSHISSTEIIQSKSYSQKLFSYILQHRTILLPIAILICFIAIYKLTNTHYPSEQAIAVLPLENLTGNADNDYFVAGVHEALISELSQNGSLRVISRTSSLRYTDSTMHIKDIAKELEVSHIVEGSVHISGDSIRLFIQLINVLPKEHHLMTCEYADNISNILQIHALAAKDLAEKLSPQ